MSYEFIFFKRSLFLLFYHLQHFVLVLEIFIELTHCFEFMPGVFPEQRAMRTNQNALSHTNYLQRFFMHFTKLLDCHVLDYILLLGLLGLGLGF